MKVVIPLMLLCGSAFAQVPECELRSTAAASIYIVAIYAHEDVARPGMRYIFQAPPQTLEPGYVARPCPCEGYPIGFEWYTLPPEFEKSTPVLVKSCGDTGRVFPYIFKDGFESGSTNAWN